MGFSVHYKVITYLMIILIGLTKANMTETKLSPIELTEEEYDLKIHELSDRIRELLKKAESIESFRTLINFPIVTLLSNFLGFGTSTVGHFIASAFLGWPGILAAYYGLLVVLFPNKAANNKFEKDLQKTAKLFHNMYLKAEDRVFDFLEHLTDQEKSSYSYYDNEGAFSEYNQIDKQDFGPHEYYYENDQFYHRFPAGSAEQLYDNGIDEHLSYDQLHHEIVVGNKIQQTQNTKLVNPMQRIPSLIAFDNGVVRPDFYSYTEDIFNIVSPPESHKVELGPKSSEYFMNIVLNSHYQSGKDESKKNPKRKSNIVTGKYKDKNTKPNPPPMFKDDWKFTSDVDPRRNNNSENSIKIDSFVIHSDDIIPTDEHQDLDIISIDKVKGLDSIPTEKIRGLDSSELDFSELVFPNSKETSHLTTTLEYHDLNN